MNGRPAGKCQVCDIAVDGYGTEVDEDRAFSPRFQPDSRISPIKYLIAEPCGHVQPEPVLFAVETPTYC